MKIFILNKKYKMMKVRRPGLRMESVREATKNDFRTYKFIK